MSKYSIIYPMAGFGTRFTNEGFTTPKPFIKIKDQYIFEYSIKSLQIPGYYYIITRELEEKYIKIINEVLTKYQIKGTVINLDSPTSGATDTCYRIKDIVPLDSHLVITNCDQYTPWDVNKFLEFVDTTGWDSIVTTYNHYDIELGKPSKYSFIKVDENKNALQFAEKFAISPHALNGIHFWRKASDFFSTAQALLSSNHTQEDFISLTFNYLLDQGKSSTYYHMSDSEFFSLGSPKEIKNNLEFLD